MPDEIRNAFILVLVAERTRQLKWPSLASDAMSRCTNPAYVQLWQRWSERFDPSANGRGTP